MSHVNPYVWIQGKDSQPEGNSPSGKFLGVNEELEPQIDRLILLEYCFFAPLPPDVVGRHLDYPFIVFIQTDIVITMSRERLEQSR